MKRKNSLLPLLTLTLLITTTILAALLWTTTKKSQTEITTLRAELHQLKTARPKTPPTTTFTPTPSPNPELENQKRELLQLRNEVAQFRASRDAAKRSQEAIANLQHYPTKALIPVDAPSVPASDWRYMGYATPHSALLSRLSAARTGDLTNLLESVTSGERARMERNIAKMQIQRATDAQITERFQQEFAGVTGIRIVGQREPQDGVVILDVYLEGVGALKKFSMNQINNEWKAAGSTPQTITTSEMISSAGPVSPATDNPELLKRYFPQLYETLQKKQAEQTLDLQPQAIPR